MNKAERIEKVAEWLYEHKPAYIEPWFRTKGYWTDYAESTLDFLATLGAVWQCDDQTIPQPPDGQMANPIIELQDPDGGWRKFRAWDAGWRKVEGV